jgi:DNA-binding response OmpR family regulator
MAKVLIIDDDKDIIETTGALLEFEGFEIHSSETVEDGIAMIEKEHPDIILLSWRLPRSIGNTPLILPRKISRRTSL